MIPVREAILVEGRYDRNVLSQIVDTAIYETGGFRILKDPQMIRFLRQVAEKRGLIILTDSDGAGFVIRNRIKGTLPAEKVLNAYIPQITGKERRKQKAGKEGLLGVEGMTPEIILDALRRCGAHLGDEQQGKPSGITRQELFRLGLMGGEGSRALRNWVKAYFSLPSHLGTSGFLDALNLITTPEELNLLVAEKKTCTER